MYSGNGDRVMNFLQGLSMLRLLLIKGDSWVFILWIPSSLANCFGCSVSYVVSCADR